MTQYLVSVKDDSKANNVFALLRDLAYIDISKREVKNAPRTASARKRRPSEIITPISVENFRLFSREELNER